MKCDAVLLEIQRVLRGTLTCPDLVVTRGTEAIDVPGWDSLAHTMILLELETAFGVRLPLESLPGLATVGDLADVLTGLVAARASEMPSASLGAASS